MARLSDTSEEDEQEPFSRSESDNREKLYMFLMAEYGAKTERYTRIFTFHTSALFLSMYLGNYYLLLWPATIAVKDYIATKALFSSKSWRSSNLYPTALAIYTLGCYIFISVPIYLMTVDDPILNYVAVCAVVGLGIKCLWRQNLPRELLYIDISHISVAVAAQTFIFVNTLDNVVAIFFVVLCSFFIVFYYYQALKSQQSLGGQIRSLRRTQAQSLKMEAVGNLTGGIAHDFNNLLTVIQGNLELAEMIEDPHEKKDLINEAHAASIRAAKLVSQLLAFSRKAAHHKETFEVNAFLNTLLTMSELVLPRNINWVIQPSQRDFKITVDKVQFETALLNLFMNASDAMPDGGKISISLRFARFRSSHRLRDGHQLAPQEYCRIQINDTGKGIPIDNLNRVTEPFFTTKPVGEGSGLGLSMAKGFCEQSGGGLEIRNRKTRGASVLIYLPITSDNMVNTSAPN